MNEPEPFRGLQRRSRGEATARGPLSKTLKQVRVSHILAVSIYKLVEPLALHQLHCQLVSTYYKGASEVAAAVVNLQNERTKGAAEDAVFVGTEGA